MENSSGQNQTLKKAYRAKEKILRASYTQVSPMEFYRDLFPEGALQLTDLDSDSRGCAIFYYEPDEHTYEDSKKRIYDKYNVGLDEDTRSCSSMLMEGFGVTNVKVVKDASSEHKEKAQQQQDYFDAMIKRLDKLDRQFGAGKYKQKGKKVGVEGALWCQRVHDDLSELASGAIGKKLAFMAPISYYGKRGKNKYAHQIFALVIDLDGVSPDGLEYLLACIDNKLVPRPTYIVNSGRGLHLYYFLEEPISAYNYVKGPLTKLKTYIRDLVWNKKTSVKEVKDLQPWGQKYRVVGSSSKLGAKYPVTAYKVGNNVSLNYFREFLMKSEQAVLSLEDFRPKGKSGYGLDYWKEKNPDWYARRVLKKPNTNRKPEGRFPWLYENMKKYVFMHTHVGNRYNGLCLLFADAAQCNIPYQEVYDYACSILKYLNTNVESEEDLFTQEDINCAAQYYNPGFDRFVTIDRMEQTFGIRIERSKRNGRTREEHLKQYIPALRNGKLIKDTRFGSVDSNKQNKDGRPSVENVVRKYLEEHPDAKKAEVIKATGLSKPTVYKWFDKIKAEK